MHTARRRTSVGLLLAALLAPNIAAALVATGCSPILGIDGVALGIFDSGADVAPSETGAIGPSNGQDTGADLEAQASSVDAESSGADVSVQDGESSGADASVQDANSSVADASVQDADSSPPADAKAEAGCASGTTRCMGTLQQSCNGDGTWTAGTIVPNKCGAQCTPNTFQCGESAIGQVCSATGYWISNGSGDLCACYVPGRFIAVAGNLVEDTTTGLKWDRSTRAPDTWTNASATCNAAGLRLPTMSEWSSVIILNPDAGAGGCSVDPTPFDQAAMPTTTGDLACSTGSVTACNVWSSQAESGNIGYVLVGVIQGSAGDWRFLQSDDRTTGITVPFRCVE
jgi:hypothetical protein